jgi:hypothetical protein
MDYFLKIYQRKITIEENSTGQAELSKSVGHNYLSIHAGDKVDFFGKYSAHTNNPLGFLIGDSRIETVGEKQQHTFVMRVSEKSEQQNIIVKTFRLTQQEYEAVFKSAKDRSDGAVKEGMYVIGIADCTDFVQSLYNTAGLPFYYTMAYTKEELENFGTLAAKNIIRKYGCKDNAKEHLSVIEAVSKEGLAKQLNIDVSNIEPIEPGIDISLQSYEGMLPKFKVTVKEADLSRIECSTKVESAQDIIAALPKDFMDKNFNTQEAEEVKQKEEDKTKQTQEAKQKVEADKKTAEDVDKAKQLAEQQKVETDKKAQEQAQPDQQKATEDLAKTEEVEKAKQAEADKLKQEQEDVNLLNETAQKWNDQQKAEADKKPQEEAAKAVTANSAPEKQDIQIITKEVFDKMTPEEKQAIEDKYGEEAKKTVEAIGKQEQQAADEAQKLQVSLAEAGKKQVEEMKNFGKYDKLSREGVEVNPTMDSNELDRAEQSHKIDQALEQNQKLAAAADNFLGEHANVSGSQSANTNTTSVLDLGHHAIGTGSRPGAGVGATESTGAGQTGLQESSRPSITITFPGEEGYVGLTGTDNAHPD